VLPGRRKTVGGMTNTPSYSLLLTPGRAQVCFTLAESIWQPPGPRKGGLSREPGLVTRSLESVWTPWTDWQRNGRRLLLRAVFLASDSLPPTLPIENDTPKASAPPGGPRGVLSP
jgi:hypothetical protein